MCCRLPAEIQASPLASTTWLQRPFVSGNESSSLPTTIGVLSEGAGVGGISSSKGLAPGPCRCWTRDDLLLQCPRWHLATFPDPNIGGRGGREAVRGAGGQGCITEGP